MNVPSVNCTPIKPINSMPKAQAFKAVDEDKTESLIESNYTQVRKSGTLGKIAGALLLAILGAITAKKITKPVGEAAQKVVSKAGEKIGEKGTPKVLKDISDKIAAKIPADSKLGKIATKTVGKAGDLIKSFAKMGGNEDVLTGLIANGGGVAGAITGARIALKDDDGNGISDIKDATNKVKDAVNTVNELALATGLAETLLI